MNDSEILEKSLPYIMAEIKNKQFKDSELEISKLIIKMLVLARTDEQSKQRLSIQNWHEKSFQQGRREAEEEWKSTAYYATQQKEARDNVLLEVLEWLDRKWFEEDSFKVGLIDEFKEKFKVGKACGF